MDSRTTKLHNIMAQNDLSAADVAKILGRQVITVRIWRTGSDNRVIPNDALKVLEMTVQARRSKGGK